MPDKPADKQPEPVVMSDSEAMQERARRAAREAADEPKPAPAEVPGGRYIVDGRTVDAEGKEV